MQSSCLFDRSLVMCTGLLKKLWADLDEIFTVNSHWADLEMILFCPNALGKESA